MKINIYTISAAENGEMDEGEGGGPGERSEEFT